MGDLVQEILHDVKSNGKKSFLFLLFSCNPKLNHTKIEICLLRFTTNRERYLHSAAKTVVALKTDGKSFIFAA